MAAASNFIHEREELREEIDRLNRIIQYNMRIYEGRLKDAKRDSEEREQKIKQLQRKLKKAEKDFSKLEKALPDTGDVGGLKKLIDEKSARIRDLEKEIDDLSKYKEKTQDYKKEVARLKKALKKSEKELSSAQDELVDLQSLRMSAGEGFG
jgi:DNA repair exonuclease SbcCD ATPase subunit